MSFQVLTSNWLQDGSSVVQPMYLLSKLSQSFLQLLVPLIEKSNEIEGFIDECTNKEKVV